MHSTIAIYRLSESGRVRSALQTLALEVRTTIAALLNPRQIIGEVEAMRALQLEARRIEATQPDRAAALRAQAARIGL